MWLINAHTLKLTEFVGDRIPEYNILSHTWEDDEVTFQDMQNGVASQRAAYRKIVETCQLSLNPSDGIEARHWVWIDTCCIDKGSSAALSEAINSMFKYYKDAYICYVYLADLKTAEDRRVRRKIKRCRWFSRSWTLQELIAPRSCLFYNQGWEHVGSKAQLAEDLSERTGIDIEVLHGTRDIAKVSIATKMSWAAGRQATRGEDIAYSLLGLFDVNMPLLYGEGSKAFLRLQEEIMKDTNDQSLFAWGLLRRVRVEGQDNLMVQHLHKDPVGLTALEHNDYSPFIANVDEDEEAFLASSPDAFQHSGDIRSYTTEHDQTWMMTNKGVQVNFPTLMFEECTVFLLNCYVDPDLGHRIAIASRSAPGNMRTRLRRGLWLIESSMAASHSEQYQQYFWAKNDKQIPTMHDRVNSIYVDMKILDAHDISDPKPRESWNDQKRIFTATETGYDFWRVGFRLSTEPLARGSPSKNRLWILVMAAGDKGGILIFDRKSSWKAALKDSADLVGESMSLADVPTVATWQYDGTSEILLALELRDVMGQRMHVLKIVESAQPAQPAQSAQPRSFMDRGKDLGRRMLRRDKNGYAALTAFAFESLRNQSSESLQNHVGD